MLAHFTAILLHCLPAQAGEMVTLENQGRADQPTGTTGEPLVQATEVKADPCGSPADLPEDLRDLSEINLPPQTNLMRMIAEKDPSLNGSIQRTKECMTQKEKCGYWFVNPHEPLDGEENDGDGETFALMGYSRSLPQYVLNFKLFDQKRYHESAETVAGLTHRNATDESEAQKALAEKLKIMADNFRATLKAGGSRLYPYHDLPVTVSSLDEYSKIAEKRAMLLSIVACHTKKLAEEDHKLEEEMRRKLTSLTSVDLAETPAEEKPTVKMGNSAITEGGNPGKAADPLLSWQDEATLSFDSYRVARNPAVEEVRFTEEDSLFVRVNHQMRKRELPGMLGPLPMGIGSEKYKISEEFQLERY